MSETDGLIEKCDGCSQLLDWLPLGTMLEDRVWHKLAMKARRSACPA
jgi:hypothetical protein